MNDERRDEVGVFIDQKCDEDIDISYSLLQIMK